MSRSAIDGWRSDVAACASGLKGQMWLAVIDYNKDKRQVTIKPPYASA